MKFNHTKNRIPANGHSIRRDKGTVEKCLFLLVACLGLFYGIDWVDGRQGEKLTAAQLREVATEIVHVAEAAAMGDVYLVVENDITGTIDRIVQGGTAQTGMFAGQYFGLPKLDGRTKDAVAEYLRLEDGRLSVVEPDTYAFAE